MATHTEPQVTVLPPEDLKAAQATARLREKLANSGVPGLEMIAHVMDSVLVIPGTNIRFGLDALLGLVPGLGDTASSLVSIYILHQAHQQGVPKWMMAKMAGNLALDYVVGSVPLVGDVFDVYWKANRKNVELLQRHLSDRPAARTPQPGDWWFFAALVGGLVGMLAASMVVAYLIILGIGRLLTG